MYLAPVGPGTCFEGTKGIAMRQIADSTAATILLVEADADRDVIWTRPDDLPFDPEHPVAGLGDSAPERIPGPDGRRQRAILRQKQCSGSPAPCSPATPATVRRPHCTRNDFATGASATERLSARTAGCRPLSESVAQGRLKPRRKVACNAQRESTRLRCVRNGR